MSRPTIEDAKALQKHIKKPEYHIIWFDYEGFEMAHTDKERETLANLKDCGMHIRLCGYDEMPVSQAGWYMWLPTWKKFVKLPVKSGEFGTP